LKLYLRLYPDATAEDYLFPSRRKIKGQNVPLCMKWMMNKIIKPAGRGLGIRKVGWQMLRHWNSTTLDEEHFSTKVRQHRLGHASPITTEVHYTHVRDSISRQAARAIDRRLQTSRKRVNLWKIVGTNVATEVA